ncbi:MAG: pyridoxine 5'-phosphate synthase [Rhodothermales bacterium]|nr:pyridoxine 5'-phosphate synthase [Rhodothermales bacterium]
MTNLLVNIDHVATLRNARRELMPDPVHAAMACESAGADGVVFHLRQDRRHITDRDVRLLKEVVHGRLDFELSTNPEIIAFCCEICPDVATLVPENRQEVTTEGGLNVRDNISRLSTVVAELKSAGIEQVSLFVDPELYQIEAAIETGANTIELHTGDFANAVGHDAQIFEVKKLVQSAELAHELGLNVHAGHGFNLTNYPIFRDTVPHVKEVSIGFAIIARSVFVGLHVAVQEMLDVIKHSD